MRIEKSVFLHVGLIIFVLGTPFTRIAIGQGVHQPQMESKQSSTLEMLMPGMENTVGFLSSGTTIEPGSTSESSPMIHGFLAGWTVMFHGNAVIEDVQQTGPRGADKFFSTNWFMPMMTRQFGRQSLML